MTTPEAPAPLANPDPDAVNSMFSRIARRYDLGNRLLSGGLDVWWRNRLVSAVRRARPDSVLDVATGSGDVAFALARGLPERVSILGMDFCRPMLEQAARKQSLGRGHYSNVRFAEGDGLNLPLPDGTFGAVTISFGLRNMADRSRSLREMRRVLKPGGRLFVLEFSQPPRALRSLYGFHLRRVIPAIGGWVTGDRAAYDYLGTTISGFPGRAALSAEILASGFSSVRPSPMTFGVVALHEAVS
jgi:demethylmenaquinone methyltransferase/2-methoxy-6-polyprenyl-1,4-benzoquinol methylase